MQKIYLARDALEAHFLKSLLEQAEIPATIQNELLQQIRGDIPFTMDSLPSLWVHDIHADEALALIEDHRHRAQNPHLAPNSPHWTCSCGQSHAPQFSECWKCGELKPE